MSNSVIVANRITSKFPLSIATSYALETLFLSGRKDPYPDPDRKPPKPINIKNYRTFYVNVETLLRNIFSAIKDKDKLEEEDFVYCLIEEMELIVDIFKNEGKDQCKVYFYRSTYSQTKKRFKFVKFREATTDKQKIYESQKELILKMVLKQRPNLFKSFHDIIETKEPASSLLFTHIPYDLLSYKNFTSLHLLESHTGNVKKKDLWYTKFLKQNNDLSFIPFTRKMLFIFGDKELIKPIDEAKHNIRETIIEIAKKCKWTPLTLETKINADLSVHIKDPALLDVLKTL